MKIAYLSVRLSDGKLAQSKFTSDQPWIPFNANDVLDPQAVAIDVLCVEISQNGSVIDKSL